MAIQYTFSIIKPNAVAKNAIGAIYDCIEKANLKIIAAKMAHLNCQQAEEFYAEHKGKFFFDELIQFITSGPIMLQVLAGENAIQRYRLLMGATNPEKALTGTLRVNYADSFTKNAVHGSDSAKSVKREIAFFFTDNEIYPR